jgi:hypothetical protein
MRKELIDKYLTEKEKVLYESSGQYQGADQGGLGTSYETMWQTWWGKKSAMIYVRDDMVLWSNSHEFPSGTIMDDDIRHDAQARGYIILDY